MSKKNERMLLDGCMAPAGIYCHSTLIDTLENLDEKYVANTAEKRTLFADALLSLCTRYNEGRAEFMLLADKAGEDKELQEKKLVGKFVANQAMEFFDRAIIAGYILGKYGQNNEYLDSAAARVRVSLQHMESRVPDLVEDARKKRQEINDEVVKKLSGDDHELADRLRECLK